MPRILFVTGFDPTTRARDLAYEFEKFGALVRCDVPAPRNPHAICNPYAFVEFHSSDDAKDAYYDLHGQEFDGTYRLNIQWARRPPPSVWREPAGAASAAFPRRDRERDRSRSPYRRSHRDSHRRDYRSRRDDYNESSRDYRANDSDHDRPSRGRRSLSPRRVDDRSRVRKRSYDEDIFTARAGGDVDVVGGSLRDRIGDAHTPPYER